MDQSDAAGKTLTREQLYDQLWSTSTVQLAKELGVSDVAIAKACKRHQIPKPPLGYWARKAAGQTPPRPALPVVVDPKLQSVTFRPLLSDPPIPFPKSAAAVSAPAQHHEARAESQTAEPAVTDPEVAGVLSRFNAAFAEIKVPDALRSPMPAVETTLAGLRRGAKEDRHFGRDQQRYLVYPSSDQNEVHLDVQVGRESIPRAMRLLDALLKTLVHCGFEYKVDRDGYYRKVCLELLQVRFQLRLREHTRRVEHVPTAKELKDKAQYPTVTRIPKWDYLPNGELRLAMVTEQGHSEMRSWSDAAEKPLETTLGEVVRGMLAAIDVELGRRKAAREVQRKEYEAARARWEAEERRKAEAVQVQALVQEVERWEMSKRIRQYLRAVERAAVELNGRIDSGSELDQWLKWAESVATSYDPLRPAESHESGTSPIPERAGPPE